ncbi:50S ribosomal protein L25 [Thermoproteota archaeon]
METSKLIVSTRKERGKSEMKQLRKQDIIPGVVYGFGHESIPIAVPLADLRKVYKGKSGMNVIVDLIIQGGEKEIEENVITHDVMRDPVSQKVLHVDFLKIDILKPIKTEVPVHLEGTAPGIKMGGVLLHNIKEIHVECLPKNIPNFISVDISGLEIGDGVHVQDLSVDSKITILNLPEDIIVRVDAPRLKSVEDEIAEQDAADAAVAAEEVAAEGAEEEAGEKDSKSSE